MEFLVLKRGSSQSREGSEPEQKVVVRGWDAENRGLLFGSR